MSLSAIMNTALSGLYTSQSALSVTSANITNVNTPGYAREVVRQEAVVNGASSRGVKVASVDRIVDNFLRSSMLSSEGTAARFELETEFHGRVQALLGRADSETSLAGRLDSLFSKLSSTTQDVSKAVLRQDAVAGIEDFADEVSRLASEIQALRTDASNRVAETVNSINAILKELDTLNPMIVRERVLGNATGGLEQQRDAALTKLATMIDIRTQGQPDGSIYVTTSTGAQLMGGARYELRYTGPGTVTSETIFNSITMHVVDPTTQLPSENGFALDGSISGGELKALLNMRDETLPSFADELGQLAGTIANELNTIHNAGSSYPPPQVLVGKKTGILASDRHGFTGQTEFVITDTKGAVVNKVSIDFSSYATVGDVITAVNAALGASGSLTLVNGVMKLQAATLDHGVAMVDNPANKSDRGGQGFSHFFGMNDLVASLVSTNYKTGFIGTDDHGFTAGGTLNFEIKNSENRLLSSTTLTITPGTVNDVLAQLNDPAGVGKYMTATLDGHGQLTLQTKAGYEGATLNVRTDSTSRGGTGVTLTEMFGIGNRYLADQASGFHVVSRIAKQPLNLSLGELGYGTAVGDVALSAGNNLAAQKFETLATKVIEFPRTGTLAATSMTLSQYNATLISNISLNADLTSNRAMDAKALATDVSNRHSNYSGVNLDEEMSNMIVYQNSYNASARIITSVRELYDTLLSIV